MRKRTIFAEGRAQLARVELRSAQATAADLTDKADVLEVEVASLQSALAQRDTELAVSKAQVLALKDYIANRYADEVQALDATHPLAEFQRAADVFESEGGNAGLSARQAANGHQAARAPAPDNNGRQESHTSGMARGVQSGSPDRAGDSTDSDDGDVHDGLARKRRRISSAGPSRPPTSTTTTSRRRRRPFSSSGARRQSPSSRSALAVPASSGPELPVPSAVSALAVPASSGPEVQPAPPRRRKTPVPAPAALAVPASPGPEKPPGRSSWNSRCSELPVAVPLASIAVAATAASEPVVPASPSRKRKSPCPDNDTDANADADAESSASSSSDSSDSDSSPSPPANQPRPQPHRGGTWTESEKTSLIATMVTHMASVASGSCAAVYDTALWTVIRDQLWADHGVDRGAQACRMTWNRGLRERTGIDERLRPDPGRMATSLQRRAGESV